KYGERAFRYCELDIGHALAALGYAARLLGWRLTDASHVGWGALFGALGLDREQDFPKRVRNYTELEEPELLVEVVRDASHPPISAAELARLTASASFAGTPSVIDAHPMYAWPAIHDVAAATRWPSREHSRAPAPEAALQHARSDMPAARLISSRRSAQRFDSRFVMEREAFLRLIAAAAANPACAALFPSPMVDLVLWVHRVEGVEPGVYVLPRTSERPLLTWLSRKFEVRPVASGEVGVELFRVAAVAPRELSRIARTLCCHQDIASSCAFAVAMVADIERALALDAFAYRLVHREAGAVGQALYLEAEAAGVRGTGIGCFLDDPTAEFLGVADTPARSVYHFSVGKPIDDPRIETTRAGVLAKANGEEDK
ncbi:MAG TPA: nitroreductase family protein, partial [Polyangiaceae bacterium]|nr:nitroreductase family protein [Polyangiaceae bacterium]